MKGGCRQSAASFLKGFINTTHAVHNLSFLLRHAFISSEWKQDLDEIWYLVGVFKLLLLE